MRSTKTLTALFAVAAMLGGCSSDNPTVPPVTFTQFDRMAIPAINTALIPSAQKNAFNAGSPATDQASYSATALASINALRAAMSTFQPPEDSPGIAASAVVAIVIPDIVTVNFANTLQFPNGRQLTDDVIDVELGLILNRAAASDDIDANDRTFLSTFPYLAAPN
ncbi:MAG TPA: DUF4331 family protein [Candidatus Limnocylindria bacterium]|nr:DUF4331 family protein [Candidatus Limnocylindria bacterium]